MLKSYCGKRDLAANIGEARLIAYYGIKPLPSPLCISGHEIDDHFVFAVHRHVEEVNDYFQESLYTLLRKETGLHGDVNLDSLCDKCPLHKVGN